MAQTNLTIRIDEGIKQDAEILFNRIGLNMSSAINVFFRQAIRAQAIPFELKPYDECSAGAAMDDLNAAKADRKAGYVGRTAKGVADEMERIIVDAENERI